MRITAYVKFGPTDELVSTGEQFSLAELEAIAAACEAATEAANAAKSAANASASTATTAATNAAKAAGNAQDAADAITGITAEAEAVAYGSPPTAVAETDPIDGHINLALGLPTGPTGIRGTITYSGTVITGTNTTPTAYATGIDAAIAGDRYQYNGTVDAQRGNVYKCTLGGDATTALWIYDGNIRGEAGTGSVNTVDGIYADVDGDVALAALRLMTATDANAITVQGAHLLTSSASNVPNSSSNWIITHIAYDASNASQEAISVGTDNPRYYRQKVSGTFGAWATHQSVLGQSNKNELINPYCRINQRGDASYSAAAYGYDMWTATTSNVTRTHTTDDQIQIVATAAVAAGLKLHLQPQYWQGLICPHIGKTVTLSTDVKEFSGSHFRLEMTFRTAARAYISVAYTTISATGIVQVTDVVPSGTCYIDCAIAADTTGVASGEYVYIKGMKYELGKVSTLANDLPLPDSEELERCLPYHWRGYLTGSYGYLYASAATSVMFAGQRTFSPPMVATPTATIITAPNYTNCSNASLQASKDGLALRVDATAAGIYRALNGVYDVTAEPV